MVLNRACNAIMKGGPSPQIHKAPAKNATMPYNMANPSHPDEYDVIICGTDLIQSILSSALSRAGKKVLHCDGNEWYGGFDAVLYTGSTLDCFIEGCLEPSANGSMNEESLPQRDDRIVKMLELLPREKYADLKLHSQTFIPPPELKAAVTQATEDPIAKKRIDSPDKEPDDTTINVAESNEYLKTGKDSQSCILEHNFSLDISPSLIYASGDAVQGIVKSGVADYLEFKSLKGLYALMTEDESKRRRTNRGTRSTGGKNECTGEASDIDMDNDLVSYRVPCSKGDVFRSQLLSPVDKRRLMKFLQLISDYGLAQEDEKDTDPVFSDAAQSVENNILPEAINTESSSEAAMFSINERYLNKGRSLSRPQNKAKPSSLDMDSLIRCIRDNVDFADFLTDVAKLPPRLCSVVTHALALAPFGQTQSVHQYSTKNGVDDLLRHVSALGRFGDTAFLIPMYGSGELSQAFCRSGAVFGSTYMLRRSPLSISMDVIDDGDHVVVKGVTLSGEEHIGFGDIHTDDTSKKEVMCSHVIVPSTMIPKKLLTKTATRTRVYRRISILTGSLIAHKENNEFADDEEQRYAVIIPPGTRRLDNTSAIHCVVADDSVFIAPARKGYTVLHLTTSILESEDVDDAQCLDILAKSVEFLIDSQPNEAETTRECHHISFSYSTDIILSTQESENKQSGLHICYRDTQSITCDYAFREAKRIFHEICPDSDFLALAKKVEDSIVYKNNDDSDEERVMLSNALDMIQDGMGIDTGENKLAQAEVDDTTETEENEAKDRPAKLAED